jgi:hypothetical protein
MFWSASAAAREREAVMKSINQIAQEDGDTSANEARRIREREAAIARAWRTLAYNEGESACTAVRIAEAVELPVAFVQDICDRKGLACVKSDGETR